MCNHTNPGPPHPASSLRGGVPHSGDVLTTWMECPGAPDGKAITGPPDLCVAYALCPPFAPPTSNAPVDNEHRVHLLMAFWMHRYHTRSWGPLLCHSIHDHHLVLQAWYMHGHMLAKICTQFLEAEKHPSSCMASIFTGHVTHWTCLGCSGSAYTTACSSSCQYPATSHKPLKRVDQHSTINNQCAHHTPATSGEEESHRANQVDGDY